MTSVFQLRHDAKTARRLIKLAQEQDLEITVTLYNGQAFDGKVKDIIRENGSILLYKEREILELGRRSSIQTVHHNIRGDAICSVSVYDLEDEA